MIIVFGEILFDVFPDARQLGGAPFNFAFHLKKLGFPVRFFSRIGNDVLGDEILEFLTRQGFDPSDIQIDPKLPTGTVQVNMSNNGHSFSIDPHSAWSRLRYDPKISQALQAPCEMIYFGSLIQHYPSGRQLVRATAKKKRSPAVLFCDINLRPEFYDPDTIFSWLSFVDILKLNEDELSVLIKKPEHETPEPAAIKEMMASHGISTVVLTMGEKGSLWITQNQSLCVTARQTDNIIDTVGAGDAFAAVFSAGVLKGLDIETTLSLADRFARSICRQQGALPENETIYHDFKKRIQQI